MSDFLRFKRARRWRAARRIVVSGLPSGGERRCGHDVVDEQDALELARAAAKTPRGVFKALAPAKRPLVLRACLLDQADAGLRFCAKEACERFDVSNPRLTAARVAGTNETHCAHESHDGGIVFAIMRRHDGRKPLFAFVFIGFHDRCGRSVVFQAA
ncbi:MAG: hypothetical protein ACLT98_15560 [Eggerthellaceae bacterium]